VRGIGIFILAHRCCCGAGDNLWPVAKKFFLALVAVFMAGAGGILGALVAGMLYALTHAATDAETREQAVTQWATTGAVAGFVLAAIGIGLFLRRIASQE
jgi:amino acid transporter